MEGVVEAEGIAGGNNIKRKALYRWATSELKGYLGRGVRIVLGDCIQHEVHALFPSEDGQYMGHMER